MPTKLKVGAVEDAYNWMSVIGETTLMCKVKNVKITFKVVKENVPTMLRRISCGNLGLIATIRSLEQAQEEKGIFNGLGCLKKLNMTLIITNPKF